MTNVIQFRLPRRQTEQDRLCALTNGFSTARKDPQDVFWLKENAELLNILETRGCQLAPCVLAPYEAHYGEMTERLRFFPQYYRFHLGLCLDLEDLGMPGTQAEALCHWAQEQGLVEAELSDLQRAEARRLLSRRVAVAPDPGLDDRLRAFAGRSDTFALPNRKAAYELTHIVFYLSHYGRSDPQVDAGAIVSLEYAGLLAYLDQDVDLLAEICVALRFAGHTPSAVWEDWLGHVVSGFVLHDAPDGTVRDSYHEYLVTQWWSFVAGGEMFCDPVPEGGLCFEMPSQAPGPLRQMSQVMMHLGPARSADWHRMRQTISEAVGEHNYHVLAAAEQSTDSFDAFFERFARAGT